MSDSIIAAMVSSAGTGVIAVVTSMISNNANRRLMEFKIEELRKDFSELRMKVEKHNNFMERIAKLEASASSAHKRIDELIH